MMHDAPFTLSSVNAVYPCRNCPKIGRCLIGRQRQHGNSIEWRHALRPIVELIALVGRSSCAIAALATCAGIMAYVVTVDALLFAERLKAEHFASDVSFLGKIRSSWRTPKRSPNGGSIASAMKEKSSSSANSRLTSYAERLFVD